VPARAVGGYTGSSTYLLMTKYNNYRDMGTGDGENKIAILDPNATQRDEYGAKHISVMKEVDTILGPTPTPNGGVYEWCINSAAVDANTASVFAGSEDGHFYRWDLSNNTLSQSLLLNAPTPEAYTPSIVGPDGTIYSINNVTPPRRGASGANLTLPTRASGSVLPNQRLYQVALRLTHRQLESTAF
jgi:hypothetical protein